MGVLARNFVFFSVAILIGFFSFSVVSVSIVEATHCPSGNTCIPNNLHGDFAPAWLLAPTATLDSAQNNVTITVNQGRYTGFNTDLCPIGPFQQGYYIADLGTSLANITSLKVQTGPSVLINNSVPFNNVGGTEGTCVLGMDGYAVLYQEGITRSFSGSGTFGVSSLDNNTYSLTLRATNEWGGFRNSSPFNFTISRPKVTVTKAGSGSGTVTGPVGKGSQQDGINCGSNCVEYYAKGSNVTLVATPTGGSTFAGWSDACSGVTTCNISNIQTDKSVTATFNPPATPPPPGPPPPGPPPPVNNACGSRAGANYQCSDTNWPAGSSYCSHGVNTKCASVSSGYCVSFDFAFPAAGSSSGPWSCSSDGGATYGATCAVATRNSCTGPPPPPGPPPPGPPPPGPPPPPPPDCSASCNSNQSVCSFTPSLGVRLAGSGSAFDYSGTFTAIQGQALEFDSKMENYDVSAPAPQCATSGSNRRYYLDYTDNGSFEEDTWWTSYYLSSGAETWTYTYPSAGSFDAETRAEWRNNPPNPAVVASACDCVDITIQAQQVPIVDLTGRVQGTPPYTNGPVSKPFTSNAELQWTVEGNTPATSCTASNNQSNTNWTGSKSISGGTQAFAVPLLTNFNLSCTNAAGTSPIDTVQVYNHGPITINSNVATSWQLDGPTPQTQSPASRVTSRTYSTQKEGTYTLYPESLAGYQPPTITGGSIKMLSNGNRSITYTVTYNPSSNVLCSPDPHVDIYRGNVARFSGSSGIGGPGSYVWTSSPDGTPSPQNGGALYEPLYPSNTPLGTKTVTLTDGITQDTCTVDVIATQCPGGPPGNECETAGGENCNTCPQDCGACPVTECDDGLDNDGDGNADDKDNGCWTDPTNSSTYDPTDDNERAGIRIREI